MFAYVQLFNILHTYMQVRCFLTYGWNNILDIHVAHLRWMMIMHQIESATQRKKLNKKSAGKEKFYC